MKAAAYSARLPTTAWRAKRKGGLRAMLELANIMRKEGKPTVTHWTSLGIVALVPLGVIDGLRRRRRH